MTVLQFDSRRCNRLFWTAASVFLGSGSNYLLNDARTLNIGDKFQILQRPTLFLIYDLLFTTGETTATLLDSNDNAICRSK